MKAVLVAADPYWIRTVVGGTAVPGKADVSIRPEGWPDVAAAIRAAPPDRWARLVGQGHQLDRVTGRDPRTPPPSEITGPT